MVEFSSGEVQSYQWPTVLVSNETKSLFVQVIIDVHPFWVAGACHAVVADDGDTDDNGEIAILRSPVEILRKRSMDVNASI